jgi:hypothetical protein
VDDRPATAGATDDGDAASVPGARQVIDPAVLPTQGTIRYRADRLVYQGQVQDPEMARARGEPVSESALMLIGDVQVVWDEPGGSTARSMTLQAQRVVLFVDDGDDEASTAGGSLPAGAVRGVYLEDAAVVSDGNYTVRAPRMYYDLPRNEALLIEAVLYTDDLQRRVPLYLRADRVRQTASDSFEARGARLTTSAFAEPHFAIGASRLSLGQVNTGDDEAARFAAEDLTLRWYGLPFFYWPYAAATARSTPLQRLGFGYSEEDGFAVETQWDAFALLGQTPPEGVEASLDVDYLGDEGGPAIGITGVYDRDDYNGAVRGYFIPSDGGSDDIADRLLVEQDEATRGFIRAQHRQQLPSDLELTLETAYVSDETFLEEYFRREAFDARPYTTAIGLKRQEDDWAVTAYAAYDLNDFTAQTTILQTPGYRVDRLPELGYRRIGSRLWDGRLQWFSENRLSRLRLRFGDDSPADRGFQDSVSQAFLGQPAAVSFEDAFESAGLPGGWVTRLDTRQELAAPLRLGEVNVTPFLVGRATGYDDDFAELSSEDDQVRLMGGGGLRLATQMHRSMGQVRSDWLDLDGLRHVVEPHAQLAYFEANLGPDDLPIYDPRVEGIQDGYLASVGLTQTLQTRRGGLGRQRTVDWLTVRTDLVLRDEGTEADQPLPRYFDYRPEFSRGGDHVRAQALWMVSDTLGMAGEATYDVDNSELAQWLVGAQLDQSPRLRWLASYQQLEPLDSELLRLGVAYQLTTKYRITANQVLDFGQNEARVASVVLERRLPRWRLQVLASYDQLDDDQTIGILLLPEGVAGGLRPVSLLGN